MLLLTLLLDQSYIDQFQKIQFDRCYEFNQLINSNFKF